MASLRLVRGTHDLLGQDAQTHEHIVNQARCLSQRYGFDPIHTPIMEFSDVFLHALGETSDVVTKEMFTLVDRTTGAASDMVLRPEGTAGVMRAILMNTLGAPMPQRYFYAGPMFRYERPQKGRQRQFHQLGVECVGASEPWADVETIALGLEILRDLGLEKNVELQLNTLGDTESRKAYHQVLVAYFLRYEGDLSPDSQARLHRNPLRILDSKDAGDRDIVAHAPRFSDSLNAESKAFFEAVQGGLHALNIPFTLNQRLVRGLDYYCHTAFEFVTHDLGAQGTVLAGGRYDGLAQIMGGPSLPGVGWAAGIERLSLLFQGTLPVARPVALIPLGDAATFACLKLAQTLRQAGIAVDFGYKGNVKARMKRANQAQAIQAVFLGDDELATQTALVKNLDDGTQESVSLDHLTDYLRK